MTSRPSSPDAQEGEAKRRKLDTSHEDVFPSPFKITSSKAMILYDMSWQQGQPSIQEVVTSPITHLVIGPESMRTTVHTNLFRGISEPLHQLLNSHSYEHISNINESLRHDDTNAFLQLIRLAYKAAAETSNDAVTLSTIKVETSGTANAASTRALELKPLKCNHCKKNSVQLKPVCDNCESCSPKEGAFKSFLEQRFVQVQQAQSNASAGTVAPNIVLTAPLEQKNSSGEPHTLLHFAKVWALAAKYSVNCLQESALRGFQRRLRRYSRLTDRDLDELLDVLRYLAASTISSALITEISYDNDKNDNTTDASSEKATSTMRDRVHVIQSGQALLKVLMRYVVSQIDVLLKEDEFREVMVQYGIIGLELATILSEIMRTNDN